MLRFSIIHVTGHLRLWPSLPSQLKSAALCLSRSNCTRHSIHSSQHRSVFRFTAFRSHNLTSDNFQIRIPRLASSTTCNLRLASKPNCGGVRRPRFVPHVARRLPDSLAAAGPVACRCGSVFGRWAIFSRAATCPTQVQDAGVGSGRQDTTLSTRVPHTESALEPTFTQELLQPRRVYKGEGAMQQPPPWTPTM